MILRRQRNPDDIQIGHRKWIELQSCRSGFDDSLNIDQFVDQNPTFWKELETKCEAECCGIPAFSFWQEDIDRTLRKSCTDVAKTIKDLRSFVTEHDGKLFVSSRLNQYFPQESLIRLLDHIPPPSRITIENETLHPTAAISILFDFRAWFSPWMSWTLGRVLIWIGGSLFRNNSNENLPRVANS